MRKSNQRSKQCNTGVGAEPIQGWSTSLEVGNSICDSTIVFTMLVAVTICAGCKPKESAPPPTPSVAPLADASPVQSSPGRGALPPGHPPIDGSTAPAKPKAGALPAGHPPIDPAQMPQSDPSAKPSGEPAKGGEVETLAGIKLTTPAGWIPLELKSSGGAFSTKPAAAFSLPRADDDSKDASVRVTHFPGMKNVPAEAQLNRWYNQFAQPSGKPTKDVAVAQSFIMGDATVTLADIPGNMKGAGGVVQPNYRMLAAIIEHPKGPHFVKVIGPNQTVEKWKDSVVAYLKSVEIAP